MSLRGNYDVFFPSDKVNVGQRYLFFNSLYSPGGKLHPQEDSRAPALAGEAAGLIGEGLANLEKGAKSADAPQEQWSIIKQSLQFLRVLAENSRHDQQLWLNEHFMKNPALKQIDGLQQNFQNFLGGLDDGGSFPYLQFIKYFNICLNGLEEYNRNKQYEIARLRQLEEVRKQLGNLSKKTMEYRRQQAKRELLKNNEAVTEESIQSKVLTAYLQERVQYFEDAQALKVLKSQTITNKISQRLNDVFKTIQNNPAYKGVFQHAITSLTNGQIQNVDEESIAILLSQITSAMEGIILDTINDIQKEQAKNHKTDRTAAAQRILKVIINEIDQHTRGSSGKFDIQQLEFQNICNRMTSLATDIGQRQNIAKRIFTQLKVEAHHFDARDTLASMTQETIDALKYAFKQENQQLLNYGFKERGQVIATLKKMLYNQDKQRGKTNEAYRDYRSHVDYDRLRNLANRLLRKYHGVKVHFNGRNNVQSEVNANTRLSSIIANTNVLHQALKSQFDNTGFTENYAKSDSALIELGDYEFTSIIKNGFISDLCKAIIGQLSFAVHDTGASNSKTQITQEAIQLQKDLRTKYNFSGNEFFMRGETEKRLKQYGDFVAKLTEESKKGGVRGKAAKEALAALQGAFKISTSVKSYDKYNNNLGFVGGSLGSQKNLEHQLDNILYMFQVGGISNLDKDWLLFSVYNAGAVLVGSTYKQKLEDFLSIFAVSLMFDDAGEQATYIKKATEEKSVESSGPHFLHLYLLNGIYFPASYILQLTYESLAQVYGVLSSQAVPLISNGSAIKIINNVSYGDLAGEDRGFNHRVTVDPQNWEDTFANGSPKVSLQLTFLAGFLDILEALQNLSVQIPG